MEVSIAYPLLCYIKFLKNHLLQPAKGSILKYKIYIKFLKLNLLSKNY